MVTGNFKIALDSIKSAKWRSFLTMLGIIIGVASVVTVVSIGEGVKKQVTDQITHLGSDLITVRPGKSSTTDAGYVPGVQFTNGLISTPLLESDFKTVAETPGVKTTVPMSYITATPKTGTRAVENAFVFGTTAGLQEVLNQKVEYGAFFDESETREVAVIGTRVAEELFQETVPTGERFEIRGKSFIVVGVFEEFDTVALTPNTDYNSAIFIPLPAAKKLVNNQLNIQQIFVKPTNASETDVVVQNISSRLLNSHGGQEDFSVLKQEDTLAISTTILDLLTGFISGIAAISLIVGGIGIMNIMIVSVTERTQEIGVRKAVGATNRQILSQFVIEAAVISFVGGVIGVITSIGMNFVLRIVTDLQPVITLPIMAIAVLVALLVGVVFGVAPALRAAHKDPIEALRRI